MPIKQRKIFNCNVCEPDPNTLADSEKLSFWINTYNSLVQVRLLKYPSLFQDKKSFFEKNDIIIGYQKLSLNDIENGIMRLKKEVTNKSFVSRFKVGMLDNRIHFTLNCGATSCPAIAYYKPETLEQDLADAEKVFTVANSSYDSLTNVLSISELFSWFKDDFKGEQGIVDIMKRTGVLIEGVNPKIEYVPYNWELKSKTYK